MRILLITVILFITFAIPATAGQVVLEDFSTYSDIANFLTDPRGIYTESENVGMSEATIDASGYAESNKSLKYTLPDRTADTANRCSDYTIGTNLAFPSALTEAWVEVVAKFSSNFSTVAPIEWSCSSAAEYKFIFLRTTGQCTSSSPSCYAACVVGADQSVCPPGRFNLLAGTQGSYWGFGYPGNTQGPNSDTSPYYGNTPLPFSSSVNPFDGNWHTYRIHAKIGSQALAEWWIDGIKQPSFPILDLTGVTSIYGVAMGRNMNQGPAQLQSVNWGRVIVYDTDPGWISLTDTVPPVTTATPRAGRYSTAQTITLSASESATTKYSLDGTHPSLLYTAPFKIFPGTTLKVFSMDTYGNTELTQELRYKFPCK